MGDNNNISLASCMADIEKYLGNLRGPDRQKSMKSREIKITPYKFRFRALRIRFWEVHSCLRVPKVFFRGSRVLKHK